MIYCMLGKILPTIFAILLHTLKAPVYLQSFVIGILPIWLEVLASTLLRYEPSREKNPLWLRLDAVIDTVTFVVVPTIWFCSVSEPRGLFLGLVVFVTSGCARILRFLENGLSSEGAFTGLPVTYTGYLWSIFVFFEDQNFTVLTLAFLFTASWAMLSKNIKIKASRPE